MILLYIWIAVGIGLAIGEMANAEIVDLPPRRWPETLFWVALCVALGPLMGLAMVLASRRK